MLYWFIACLFLPSASIHAQRNNDSDPVQRSALNIAVAEHAPSQRIPNGSSDLTWQTTTEKTLIRVTRLNDKAEKAVSNHRQRRQVIEAIQTAGFVINVAKAMRKTESGEEILGMAKKVAIVVLVIASLCAVCCLVTTVLICVKCCCGKNDRKRNQPPTTIQVPQPIFVHTGPSGYQPQFYPTQQQAPQAWSPTLIEPPESRPMLPRPSAPPQPADHFHTEHPPPAYEKLYTGK